MKSKETKTTEPLRCPHCGMDAKYTTLGTQVGYRCGSLFDVSLILDRSPSCVVIAELNREIRILKGEGVY